MRRALSVCRTRSYDVDNKTYLFKMALPERDKVTLLMESGVRFHTTKFEREKSAMPSNFVMKLRKHLRTRRIESIRQLGQHRVIDFKFGVGENAGHIILELYAGGNLILTDYKYKILTALRTHEYDEDSKVAAHEIYPIAQATEGTNVDDVNATGGSLTACEATGGQLSLWLDTLAEQNSKSAKPSKMNIKQALSMKGSGVHMLGPVLLEHCICTAGLSANDKVKQGCLSATDAELLISAFAECAALQNQIACEASPGYICATKSSGGDAIYQEFVPVLLAQHSHFEAISFDSFISAVDEYYSKLESQRQAVQEQAAKDAVLKKTERMVKDQQGRIDSLCEEQEHNLLKARLLELHKADVDNAVLVVRSALASGMDWEELAALVHAEKENGNPIASLIHSLNLNANRITLELRNYEDEDGEGDEDEDGDENASGAVEFVEIDVGLSAYANASSYYSNKKSTAVRRCVPCSIFTFYSQVLPCFRSK